MAYCHVSRQIDDYLSACEQAEALEDAIEKEQSWVLSNCSISELCMAATAHELGMIDSIAWRIAERRVTEQEPTE